MTHVITALSPLLALVQPLPLPPLGSCKQAPSKIPSCHIFSRSCPRRSATYGWLGFCFKSLALCNPMERSATGKEVARREDHASVATPSCGCAACVWCCLSPPLYFSPSLAHGARDEQCEMKSLRQNVSGKDKESLHTYQSVRLSVALLLKKSVLLVSQGQVVTQVLWSQHQATLFELSIFLLHVHHR